MTGGSSCPSVSVILLTYNQEPYVEEAVRSVLAQTYGPLEILVSDDASTDRTAELARRAVETYRGPHQVQFQHNATNLGLIAHVNQCVELTSGRLIVAAGGDDVSLPQRVERLVQSYVAGVTYSLFSNLSRIDERGKELGVNVFDVLPSFATHGIEHVPVEGWCWVAGASHAWDRRLFTYFGPLPLGLPEEDSAIPFRALLLGRIAYVDEPLVRYRVHGGNLANHGRPRDFSSKSIWLASLQVDWRAQVERLRSYGRDLEVFGETSGVTPVNEFVRVALQRRTEVIQRRLAMLERRNPLRRVRLLGEMLLVRDVAPGELRLWAKWFGAPRIYLWRRRRLTRKASVSRDRPTSGP